MPMRAPVRVSVVVPTRGRPDQLRQALACVRALESSQLSIEMLVCDNGHGEAAEVAREFGARYLTVARVGAAAARNAGMRAATGEYLAFLDDDDLWLPGHLVPHIELLEARPDLHAVLGQVITTDHEGTAISDPWPTVIPADGELYQSFLADYPQIGATVVRTKVRETVGLLDEDLLSDEDWDWHLRLARAGKIGFVPVPSVLFRQRAPGTFDRLQWMRVGYMRRVLVRSLLRSGRHRPGPGHTVRILLHHHRMYYTSFVESATRHLAHGDRGAMWRAIGYATAASPIHAVLGALRSGGLRDILATILLGRSLPELTGWPVDATPLVLAPTDRPDRREGFDATSDVWIPVPDNRMMTSRR